MATAVLDSVATTMPGHGRMTCIACRLQFAHMDELRQHYRTEWHRFNLKRKVAGLPAVTQDAFEARLNDLTADKTAAKGTSHLSRKQREEAERRAQRAEEGKGKGKGKDKGKGKAALAGRGAAGSSAGPSIEGDAALSSEEEDHVAVEDPRATRELSLEDSLFDRHRSETLQENLEYMAKRYGFFVPDIEYLVDPEGLIKYLGEKVGVGNVCLFCQKAFKSAEAVQAHMVDASHCKLDWDGNEGEYADFYDYSSSYDHALADSTVGEDEGEEDEEEWEDVDGEDGEEEELTEEEARELVERREERMVQQYVKNAGKGVVGTNEFGELVLASGKLVGHRHLRKYYRQKITMRSELNERIVRNVMAEYQLLGYRPRDIGRVRDMPKEQLNRRNRLSQKTGIAANNQKHFRTQNPI